MQVFNLLDASGTVGTTSTQVQGILNRIYFQIQNISSVNSLGITVDGKVAAIGVPGTITLAPGQGLIYQGVVPAGVINVIGSGSGTTYTIKYA